MTGLNIITDWIVLFSLFGGYDTMNFMYVKQGSNVVLKCPYKPVIYWSNPATKELLTIGLARNIHIDMYSRLSIATNFDLTIHNFTSSDERTYRCTSQQENQHRKTFNFRPLLARSPKDMKINGKLAASFLYADEGIKFKLTCTVVSGEPAETLKWVKNEHTLSLGGPGNVSFTFIPKESNDGENYTCSAKNIATDNPVSRSVQLFVNLRPRVTLHADPSQNINEGQKLIIICNYKSKLLQESIKWFKRSDASSNSSELIQNRSFVVAIDKVTKQHMGEYTCQVTNRLGTDQFQLNITVNFPPTIYQRKPVYDIDGKIGKPIPIQIDIDCFPSSTVSWAQTAGGKLGTWTTTPQENFRSLFRQTFSIKSTVLPTTEDHFGQYYVIVRNSIGSLELLIRLHLNESRVNVMPHPPICAPTQSVELKCNIMYEEKMKWIISWEHYFNGVHVQTLQGITGRRNAKLEIIFCDFKDNGEYVCVWDANRKKLLGSTSLTVYDKPVITHQNIEHDLYSIIMSVYFYDNTNSSSCTWFVNDELSTNDTNYHFITEPSEVTLDVYGINVRAHGFRTAMFFKRKMVNDVKLINCDIRNIVGSITAVFRRSEVEAYFNSTTTLYLTSSGYYQNTFPYKRNTTIFEEIPTSDTLKTETFNVAIGSIYVAAPGLFILFLCIVLLSAYTHTCVIRSCSRHIYDLRVANSTEVAHSRDEEPNRSIYEEIEMSNYITADGNSSEMLNYSEGRDSSVSSHYVEITDQNAIEENSAYYEMVEWRNSIVISDESELEHICADEDINFIIQNNIEGTPSSYSSQNSLSDMKEGESEETKRNDDDISDIADQSHLYFTVLPND